MAGATLRWRGEGWNSGRTAWEDGLQGDPQQPQESLGVFDPHQPLVPVVHPVAVSVYSKLLCLVAFSSLLPQAPDRWAEGRGQGPALLLWASAGRKDLTTLRGLGSLHHGSQPRPWGAHRSFFSLWSSGVWATKPIFRGRKFGPFVGDKKKRSQVKSNVYMWEVKRPLPSRRGRVYREVKREPREGMGGKSPGGGAVSPLP